MSLASCVGGLVNVAPAALKLPSGPPPTSFVGIFGQIAFDATTVPYTPYIYTGTGWSVLYTAASNTFAGTGTLALGTVTIANTSIATGDIILLTRTAVNASTTLGEFTYTITAGTSFTVTSVILGTPASTQTGDLSSFGYVIIRPL